MHKGNSIGSPGRGREPVGEATRQEPLMDHSGKGEQSFTEDRRSGSDSRNGGRRGSGSSNKNHSDGNGNKSHPTQGKRKHSRDNRKHSRSGPNQKSGQGRGTSSGCWTCGGPHRAADCGKTGESADDQFQQGHQGSHGSRGPNSHRKPPVDGQQKGMGGSNSAGQAVFEEFKRMADEVAGMRDAFEELREEAESRIPPGVTVEDLPSAGSSVSSSTPLKKPRSIRQVLAEGVEVPEPEPLQLEEFADDFYSNCTNSRASSIAQVDDKFTKTCQFLGIPSRPFLSRVMSQRQPVRRALSAHVRTPLRIVSLWTPQMRKILEFSLVWP